MNLSFQEGLHLDWHLGKVKGSELKGENRKASALQHSPGLRTFLFNRVLPTWHLLLLSNHLSHQNKWLINPGIIRDYLYMLVV